jgi:hypothetical protein
MDPPISIPHEFLTKHPKSEWNPDVQMPEHVGLIDLPLKDSDTARVSGLELVWTPIGHFCHAYFFALPSWSLALVPLPDHQPLVWKWQWQIYDKNSPILLIYVMENSAAAHASKWQRCFQNLNPWLHEIELSRKTTLILTLWTIIWILGYLKLSSLIFFYTIKNQIYIKLLKSSIILVFFHERGLGLGFSISHLSI